MQPRRTYVSSILTLVDIKRSNPDETEVSCAICTNDFTGKELINKDWSHVPVGITCGHIFCQGCIVQWLLPEAIYEPHLTVAKISEGAWTFPYRETEECRESDWLDSKHVFISYVNGSIEYVLRQPAPPIPFAQLEEHHRETNGPVNSFLVESFAGLEHEPKNRDKCPMCRTRIVPERYKIIRIDADETLKNLPLLLGYFYRKNFKAPQYTLRVCQVLNGVIAVALLNMHNRLFHRNDVEKELIGKTIEQMEHVDWWLWGLPKMNTPKKVREYKWSVKMFLRLLVGHIIDTMPMVRVLSD